MNDTKLQHGAIVRISGPVVGAVDVPNIRLHDLVYVGEERLMGEIIRLNNRYCTIQVHEETSGVRIGEPVWCSSMPLVVELGPGLVGQVFDGLQRPLDDLAELQGAFLKRGTFIPPLGRDKRWDFVPLKKKGDEVGPGCILGTVQETKMIEHRIMVPPGKQGRIVNIRSGKFNVTEPIVTLEVLNNQVHKISMMQRWPVRVPRPVSQRIASYKPLITGTRIIDLFFPVAKGGTAIIPGGFGTGKTATMQSLARWSDADIVVYVGCGERGNEMAAVLAEFPNLEDPRSGESLINRTVLIANTSNMPVAARVASIYTGITISEYYRDMGYDVVMLADSTSRWGEALREISGRLEEIPGEEGYPAYLSSRISEFYERAGCVRCLGNSTGSKEKPKELRKGSVSLIGAVSPPGGDFSEPITQSSMRVAGTFWALDYDLSRRRHFPAINWIQSYSLYRLQGWFEGIEAEWVRLNKEAMSLLSQEDELLKVVQLIGKDALSESQQEILAVAKMLREDLLQQSALDENDRYSPLKKSFWMMKNIMDFHKLTLRALEADIALDRILKMPIVAEIGRMKEIPIKDVIIQLKSMNKQIYISFSEISIRIE